MNLTRSRDGKIVHAGYCIYAERGLPWLWATGKSRHVIEVAMWAHGLRACKACGAESLTPHDATLRIVIS